MLKLGPSLVLKRLTNHTKTIFAGSGKSANDSKHERFILDRLKDRTRIPRSLWCPYQQKIHVDEDTPKLHADCSRTINRMFLAIVGFCLFCVITLSGSDEGLLGVGAEVTLPFAGVKMTVKNFLFAGPLILTAFTAYLHLFIGEWIKLHHHVPPNKRAAHFFNFEGFFARLLTQLAFYWLPLTIFWFFVFKAIPLPSAFEILSIGIIASVFIVWVSIRRCEGSLRLYWNIPKWIALFVLGVLFASAATTNIPWSRQLQLQEAKFKGINLVEFNLQDADLTKADLEGAKLSKANLGGARLFGAKLDSADLSSALLVKATLDTASAREANFADANLTEATLMTTNLSMSNLRYAMLREAHLEGADMTGAHLEGARLINAIIRWTNFSGAHLDKTIFNDVDFTEARGITKEQMSSACLEGAKNVKFAVEGPEDCPKGPAFLTVR